MPSCCKAPLAPFQLARSPPTPLRGLSLNRVPASRLAEIAAVLKAAPADFFPPIDETAPHLRRGDLNQVMEAIADQISRQKAQVEELNRVYRWLSLLALQVPTNGDAKEHDVAIARGP